MSIVMNMSPLQRRGIHTLPLETLSEIWMLATTIYDEDRIVPPSYSLLTLSQVCSMWRTVIRNTPRLWTIIRGTEPPSLIHEAIVLSQRVPLVLFNDCNDDARSMDPLPPGVEMLFAELHRALLFHTSVNEKDLLTLLPLLETADAPLLESFELNVMGLDEQLIINPFGGIAPRLTNLSLKGCEINWNSSIWKNLTHFHLDGPSFEHWPKGYQPFSQALAQMASLTNLEMTLSIPLDITSVKIHEINLPRLSSLYIVSFMNTCTAFLYSLKCQLSSLTVVGEAAEDDHEYAYLYLLDACKQRISPSLKMNPFTMSKSRRRGIH